MPRLPFLQLAHQRVVVLDGSMGANLQQRPIDLRDWMGFENACEVLNLSRPDLIQSIHESFLDVGCDAVENSLGPLETFSHMPAPFQLERSSHWPSAGDRSIVGDQGFRARATAG